MHVAVVESWKHEQAFAVYNLSIGILLLININFSKSTLLYEYVQNVIRWWQANIDKQGLRIL